MAIWVSMLVTVIFTSPSFFSRQAQIASCSVNRGNEIEPVSQSQYQSSLLILFLCAVFINQVRCEPVCCARHRQVIADETPGMHLPAGLFASLRQCRQEHLTVLLASEYLLPRVPTIYHMINRPGIRNAQFAWHPFRPSSDSLRACLKSSSRREEALTSSSYQAGKQGYLSLVTSAATKILGVFKQALGMPTQKQSIVRTDVGSMRTALSGVEG